MGLKKHRIKINIESSALPSGYVVDLRSEKSFNHSVDSTPLIDSKDNNSSFDNHRENPSISSDSVIQSSADDFLSNNKTSLFSFGRKIRGGIQKRWRQLVKDLDFSEAKETLFYPVFSSIFKVSKRILVFVFKPFFKLFKRFRVFKIFRRILDGFKSFFIGVYEYFWRRQRSLIFRIKASFKKSFKPSLNRLRFEKNFSEQINKISQPLADNQAINISQPVKIKNSRLPIWSSIDYFKKITTDSLVSDKELERHPIPRRSWKSFFLFLLFLLFLALILKAISYRDLFNPQSLKQKIMSSVSAATGNLFSASSAVSSFDFSKANTDFAKAGADFLQAQKDMKSVDNGLLGLAALSKDEHWRLASVSRQILIAGQAASVLGEDLSLAADSLNASSTLSLNPVLNQSVVNIENASGTDSEISDIASGTPKTIGPMLEKFAFYIRQAAKDSLVLENSLKAINKDRLPKQYQDQFTVVSSQVKVLSAGLQEFSGFADVLQDFLGVNHDRRYLLVFQNNNEMRASGGFIGSYALADVREGHLRNLEMPAGGSYDTEGGMRVLMAAPQPLWLVSPLWHFWDANWWPDWPTSARNLMWFYEKSDGPTVDGVISFTPTVLEKILTVIGPVDMTKDYGVVVDADNFWITTQDIIERTGNPELFKDSENKLISTTTISEKTRPKKILGDLTNKILTELPSRMDKEMAVKLATVLEESLRSKQILLYFNNENLQSKVDSHNWSGSVDNKTLGDYLMVVNTNIAGQKTDRVISQFINHSAEVLADGTIIDNVKIERVHTGKKGDLYTGVRNVDWMRLYVPLGSTLISAGGFSSPDIKYFESPDPSWQTNEILSITEDKAVTDPLSGVKIYNENGRTVFANWSMVDPGQSAVINFSYKLPFKIQDLDTSIWKNTSSGPKSIWQRLLFAFDQRFNSLRPENWFYSLTFQKQPGSKSDSVSSELKLADNFQVIWRYPESSENINGYKVKDSLDGDRRWSVIIKNPAASNLKK